MALTTSLNAYYKFDESSGNASDSVGSNTLTNNGTATYSAGKINNGTALARASTQYFSIADTSAFDLSGDFSVSCWLKVATAPTSGQQFVIMGKDANGADNTRSYDLNYANSGGTKRFELAIFPTGYSYPSYWAGAFNYDLGTATWVYVTVVVTIANGNSTKAELYINGTSQGNFTLFDGTGATSVQNSTSAFQIGYESFQGAFDGMIDEFGLWSRVLTSTEVTQLYNGGAGLAYPFGESSSNSNFLMFM